MDNSTYFNVIVTKSIPITELIYQIFKEHLSQTIVNKATLLHNSLKCCLESCFRYFQIIKICLDKISE